MGGWYYTFFLILAILVIVRGIFNFAVKLFSPTPTEYIISKEEKWLLGIAISYILTYLIY